MSIRSRGMWKTPENSQGIQLVPAYEVVGRGLRRLAEWYHERPGDRLKFGSQDGFNHSAKFWMSYGSRRPTVIAAELEYGIQKSRGQVNQRLRGRKERTCIGDAEA